MSLTYTSETAKDQDVHTADEVVELTHLVAVAASGKPKAASWAFYAAETCKGTSRTPDSTFQRAYLEAVLHLSQISADWDHPVTLLTNANYVIGVVERLDSYADDLWTKSNGDPVAHADVLAQLHNALANHRGVVVRRPADRAERALLDAASELAKAA